MGYQARGHGLLRNQARRSLCRVDDSSPHYPEIKQACEPEQLHSVMQQARADSLTAIAEIREGRIEPKPADEMKCDFCDLPMRAGMKSPRWSRAEEEPGRMSLSERQLNAAHRLGQDVCVVAGPGSGKTSVLIERFTWLVEPHGVDPGRILAITFTDKAATEIKERMVRAFAHAPEIREQIERAYVSTIHGFCARLLRENAIVAGIDPQFQVLEQPGKLLRQVADEVLESIYNEQPDRMRRFLRSLAVSEKESQWVPDLAASLIAIYEGMRIAGAEIGQARLIEATPPYEELRSLARPSERRPASHERRSRRIPGLVPRSGGPAVTTIRALVSTSVVRKLQQDVSSEE